MILVACRSGILKLGNVCATHDSLRETICEESTTNFYPTGWACVFPWHVSRSNLGCTDRLEFETMMMVVHLRDRARMYKWVVAWS